MFKRVLQTLDTVTERVSYIFIYISGFLAVVMACLATFGVIKRYVLNDPEPYTYEISTIFLLVGVIFAIPYVQQVRRNLRVDVIANRLPKAVQDILANIVTPLLGLFFLVPMVWKSWEAAFYSLRIGERSPTIWSPYLFPIKITIPIGVALLCFVLLIQLCHGVNSLIQRIR